MIEVFLFGIVLGLIPITLAGATSLLRISNVGILFTM